MENGMWDRFVAARERYRRELEKLRKRLPQLRALQQSFVDGRSQTYTVETPVVYNTALDAIGVDSEIRLILIGDNPGRREQARGNRRYLVGPSGKIAEKFFREQPSLHIDFRTNVIILNKTPIHSPRTGDLKELCRLGGTAFAAALEQSQRCMAGLLLEFHEALINHQGLPVPVWITGYSEMKRGGIFETYTEELRRLYSASSLQQSVFLYRHFSMNQFTIDLKRQAIPGETLHKTLNRIGTAYRKRFLW